MGGVAAGAPVTAVGPAPGLGNSTRAVVGGWGVGSILETLFPQRGGRCGEEASYAVCDLDLAAGKASWRQVGPGPGWALQHMVVSPGRLSVHVHDLPRGSASGLPGRARAGEHTAWV